MVYGIYVLWYGGTMVLKDGHLTEVNWEEEKMINKR